GNDVVDMLNPDRQAHVTVRNAGGELLFFGELRVRRRRRMDGETPRVANIGDMIVKLQRINELAPCLFAASQLEADQPAEMALEVPVGALAVDALLLRWMYDPLDFLSCAQEIDNGLSVLAVLDHAQCKRFQTLNDQKCIEWRQRRAEIAQ